MMDSMQPNRAMREFIFLDHRRMRLMGSLFGKYLSKGDFSIMDMIYRYREDHPDIPGMYASVIAERSWVTPSAVSRQLQQLEDRGLIQRTVDPQSRRRVFVSLTAKGTDLLLLQYEVGKTLHDNVYYAMGAEKMDELLGNMRQLTAIIEQEVERMKQSEEGGDK